MDALAKEYRTKILALNPNQRASSFQIVNEGWSIWHNDEKLASPGRKILYECVYAPIILQYWTTPHTLTPAPRFPPAAATMIDWVATEDLMTCLNPSKQRWCMKHGSENCGVGATLLYWKKQLDDECPRCRASEDTTHVLRCTAHNASVIWNTNMDLMKADLASLETPLQLRTALLNRLQCWRDNSPLTADPLWTPSLASLIQSQDTIGWKNFMEGLPSNLWSPFMALHYKTNSIERRPKIWLRKILRAAHHLAWSQWEHRNKILHHDEQPRAIRAVDSLNDAIGNEYLLGVQDLPALDHHHFLAPLGDLISLSTSYKQSWYLNVMAARQRQDRRILATGQQRIETEPNPQLTHWIATGRYR
jgi:hypothetical protein